VNTEIACEDSLVQLLLQASFRAVFEHHCHCIGMYGCLWGRIQ